MDAMRHDAHRCARGILARWAAAALLLSLGGCAADVTATGGQSLVSEQDDRTEPFATEFPWMRSLAQYGTVALVHASYIQRVTTPVGGYDTLVEGSVTVGEAYNLCPGERFADQRMTSFCSGVLIDDDLVLTSGSCLNAEHTCENTRFVFDHYNTAPGVHAPVVGGVFSCREVVVAQHGSPGFGDPNFAVIRLDSPVGPRYQPVPVRTARAPLDPGQHVKLVGHPYGIPAKIEAQGNVVLNDFATNYFLASLDVFRGENGAGVYESDNYTLAGIWVAYVIREGMDLNELDYTPRALPDGGTCNTATRCTEAGCATAGVLYLGPVLDALCADPARSPRLCGAAPPVNDRCTSPSTLPLGYDVTIAGSTQFATPEVTPSCSTVAQRAPDVFYSLHVDVPLVLYVDAFNSDFPVLLNLMRDGCDPSRTVACNGSACGTGMGQIAAYLEPGTYYLQVTGRGGTRGRYSLHVQALGGAFRTERIRSGARTVTGTDLGPVYAGRNTCAGTPSRGTLYYYTTCPSYRGGAVRASTCGRAGFDTVLSFAQGNARDIACANDTCGAQETLRATATPGSGLRGIYLDARGADGPYSLFYTVP